MQGGKRRRRVVVAVVAAIALFVQSPAYAPVLLVTAGAFCSPAGAVGIGSSGKSYTCQDDGTGKNRWL